MKEIVELFMERGILFKSLEEIDKSYVNSKKRIRIFSGVDVRSYYHSIFLIESKSRILKRYVLDIFELQSRLEKRVSHSYRYRHIVLSSPLCSKAKVLLKESGWKAIYREIK